MRGRLADFWLFGLCLTAGCAAVDRVAPEAVLPPSTCFERVGSFDFRPNAPGGPNALDDLRRRTEPGDLLVAKMDFKRALARRQWLFCVLPCGHALVMLDPHAERGILECRFHGAQRVGPDELLQYTECELFRLRDRSHLSLARLHDFADVATARTKAYNFRSWIGLNDNLSPTTPAEISTQYTCSTFVAAAYHYAGLRFSASEPPNRVVTPLSLAASVATPVETVR